MRHVDTYTYSSYLQSTWSLRATVLIETTQQDIKHYTLQITSFKTEAQQTSNKHKTTFKSIVHP